MLSTELEIRREAYLAISILLEKDSLIEQVGLCFGILTLKKIRADIFIEMENLNSSPSSFSIDYGIFAEHINKFYKKNQSLIGFFHSHPPGKPLHPSKKDESYMKLWPHPYVWFIGAYPKQLLAFTLLENKITQLPFKIVPER
jgi:proteasome lid subunit RPN8/RPN11